MSDAAACRVWRIAGPIILSNVSVPLLGAVDTAVIGHLADPAYLGGVAVGAMIFNFLYWGFGFLRMGTTGFVAQAAGAGDAAEVRAILGRALLVATALALALIAPQRPIGRGAAGK
ncbi:MAG: MATE family efflux transporter, partial [Rhodospirillaceae bacterium]|nr:MATE family efflux transporter [Rhodospirillaceae bacterium]